MVQPVDQLDQIVTLVRHGVIERVGGDMQELVCQAIAQGLKDLVRIFAFCQQLLRPVQLMAPPVLV